MSERDALTDGFGMFRHVRVGLRGMGRAKRFAVRRGVPKLGGG